MTNSQRITRLVDNNEHLNKRINNQADEIDRLRNQILALAESLNLCFTTDKIIAIPKTKG